MNKLATLLLSLTLVFTSCISEHQKLKDGIFAEIETSKGKILLELEYEKTPVTVANFVSLAEGKNTLVSENFSGKPFYEGLKFHRVLKDFMIQGGDPDGTGSGGPGYKFKDEFLPELKMDKAGVLAMANAGPGTNGSQFFITHKEANYLNGRHTVFGQVIEGQNVVDSIQQDDKIIKIEIIRKGSKAQKFDAPKVFKDHFEDEINAKKTAEAKYAPNIANKKASFISLKETTTKTESGLQYKILQSGTGKKPASGTEVYVHYAGFFENGTLFDSSYENVSEAFGKLDPNRAAAKQYLPFPFKMGQKDGLIPGFLEGLEKMKFGDKAILFIPSGLGYGPQGFAPIIPPNTNLVFELEMLEKMPK